MGAIERLADLYMNGIYQGGAKFLRLKSWELGLKGIQVLRKIVLNLFFGVVGVVLVTAGFFIAVTDAFLQFRESGFITTGPVIWYGVLLAVIPGALLLWAFSERRLIMMTGLAPYLDRLFERHNGRDFSSQAEDPLVELRNVIDRLVEERVRQKVDERLKVPEPPIRKAPDEAYH